MFIKEHIKRFETLIRIYTIKLKIQMDCLVGPRLIDCSVSCK